MGLRQCDKCTEMVDEAKAFCPACGHAFVEEEKRQDVSSFEQLDHTVKLGNTMYNQMLSDMGLNISKAPEKRIETIAPIEDKPAPKPAPAPPTAASEKSSRLIWVLVVLVAVVLLPLAAVSVIYLARELLSRF